jgi:hypothetical protein
MWILFGLYDPYNENPPHAYFKGLYQTLNDAKKAQSTGDFIREVDLNTYDWSNSE